MTGRTACATDSDAPPPAAIASALAGAEIPASKLGAARWAGLEDSERDFYFWILRRFATSGRPTNTDLLEVAGGLELDFEEALGALADEDLVHLGSDGEIGVAYPFSGRRTRHVVRFASGHEAYAMCAIDALGIAAMFGERIEISSIDPLTGEDVHVTVAPDGRDVWLPRSAVVVAGTTDQGGEAFRGCCPVLNFFASTENARAWLDGHPAARGNVISMREAIAAGAAIFGGALKAV